MPTVKEMREALKAGLQDPRKMTREEGQSALEAYRESDTYKQRNAWLERNAGARAENAGNAGGVSTPQMPQYRSSETVQADLDTLSEQIRTQRETDRQKSGWYDKSWWQRAGDLMRVASGAVQEDGEEPKADTEQAEVSQELQALLDRQASLQEELALSQYNERQATAEKERQMLEADLAELATWSREEQALLRDYAINQFPQDENMAAAFVNAQTRLEAKYGRDRVREIAESYMRRSNEETNRQMEESAKASANTFWGGALGSGISVGANLVGGMAAPLGYLGEAFTRTGRYSTLDPNQTGTAALAYSGALRNQVAENIRGEKKEGEGLTWGDVGATVYMAGMSALDSLTRIAVGGEIGSLGLAAVGSFGQTVQQASNQGASPTQAVALGVVTGGLEVLTEKVPLDNLLKQAKGGYQGLKAAVKSAMIAGGVEVSEEELNFLCSTLAEAAILQEKSAYNQQIQELVASGMRYEEAKEQADRALINEATQTAIQSFLSGGMMSGATTLYSNTLTRMQGGQNGGAQAGQTTQEGAEAPRAAQNPTEETAQEQEEAPVSPAEDMADRLMPVQSALTAFRQNGTVSGRLADIVAGLSDARKELTEKTGIQIAGTKSQQRNAVRQAIAALAEQQDTAKAQEAAAAREAETPEQAKARYANEGIRDAILGPVQNAAPSDTADGIRAQLRNSQTELASMEPVAQIHTPGEFSQMDLMGKIDWVIEKLRPTNYKVDRKGFGVINFAKKQIRSAFNYFKSGTVEEAAFEALPYVLEHGTEISSHGDHKGRGYTTVTFAAPVTINGKRGNMAVVVRQTTGNYYKVHRILSPDGSVFDLSETAKAEPTMAGEAPDTGSLATPKGSASAEGDVKGTTTGHRQPPSLVPSSDNSITEKGRDVNGESEMEHGAVGAAEQNFSGKQAFNELLSDENAQPDRPGDVRPMEIPKSDGYGRKVSEFAANAYGAEVTPDGMADRIQELIGDGALGFDSRTNEASLKTAAEAIREKGMAKTEKEITLSVANGKIKDGDIEKAMLLYGEYANRKGQANQDRAAELMVDLATMANITGRNLQLFKLMRKLTPEGQLLTVQKTVDRTVDRINKRRRKGKQAEVKIPPELQGDYLDAAKKDGEKKTKETAKAKEDAEKAIYMAAASQIQATFAEKWNAWRYMAMLGNVKTQVRNVVGNAAFMPYTDAKRILGAAMERFIPKEQRTKALVGFSEGDRALRNWAKADSKTDAVRDALKYSAKLGDDMADSRIQENRRIFDSRILEQARKITKAVPEMGDMIFKNREYTEALAGFVKAQGYSAADIESGKVSESALNAAREYAIQEAMKATFNDSNAFSDFMANGLRYKGENPVGRAVNLLGEGLLPFRRTPANIVVRMVENSPVNIARSVWNMATKVRTGEMSAATAIDQLAAGLTGTGVMALGYALAKGLFGIRLRGSDVDEDEERRGHQAYSIEFSIDGKEYSYRIDWAAPANLPLFLGANLYDLAENAGADTGFSQFTSFVYSMGTMFEPMLSLSCMSSLNDLFSAGKYAEDGEEIYAVLTQAATSYFTQGIPALLRQAYQASQKTKQQTFANSEDPLLRDLQRTAANIPFIGAAFQTDSIDEWGEEESRGNVAQRIFDAFFNPGTLKEIDTGALEQEIARLNETQGESVSPPDIPKTISFTDADGNRYRNRRLTEEEWNTLRTVQGQTAAEILNAMIGSHGYTVLTDEQRAAAFGYVYDYAREKARTEAIAGYDGMDGWMEGIEGDESEAIIRKVTTGAFSDAFEDLTAAWNSGNDPAGAVEALEAAYRVYKGMKAVQRKAIAEEVSGRVADCIAAMDAGVDAATFAELYQSYYGIGKSGDKPAQQANTWAYELQKAVENGTITEKQRDVLKETMTISSGYTVETEKFDSMVESGLKADKADYVNDLMRGIEPQAGYANVRPVQQAEAIAGAKLTESEKVTVMKLYMNDAQDENLDQMLEMGYDVGDYVKAYRIYSDASGEGKKKRTIEEYRKIFGVDEATARAIYEIYG